LIFDILAAWIVEADPEKLPEKLHPRYFDADFDAVQSLLQLLSKE
jgi:hypothetical protein